MEAFLAAPQGPDVPASRSEWESPLQVSLFLQPSGFVHLRKPVKNLVETAASSHKPNSITGFLTSASPMRKERQEKRGNFQPWVIFIT